MRTASTRRSSAGEKLPMTPDLGWNGRGRGVRGEEGANAGTNGGMQGGKQERKEKQRERRMRDREKEGGKGMNDGLHCQANDAHVNQRLKRRQVTTIWVVFIEKKEEKKC